MAIALATDAEARNQAIAAPLGFGEAVPTEADAPAAPTTFGPDAMAAAAEGDYIPPPAVTPGAPDFFSSIGNIPISPSPIPPIREFEPGFIPPQETGLTPIQQAQALVTEAQALIAPEPAPLVAAPPVLTEEDDYIAYQLEQDQLEQDEEDRQREAEEAIETERQAAVAEAEAEQAEAGFFDFAGGGLVKRNPYKMANGGLVSADTRTDQEKESDRIRGILLNIPNYVNPYRGKTPQQILTSIPGRINREGILIPPQFQPAKRSNIRRENQRRSWNANHPDDQITPQEMHAGPAPVAAPILPAPRPAYSPASSTRTTSRPLVTAPDPGATDMAMLAREAAAAPALTTDAGAERQAEEDARAAEQADAERQAEEDARAAEDAEIRARLEEEDQYSSALDFMMAKGGLVKRNTYGYANGGLVDRLPTDPVPRTLPLVSSPDLIPESEGPSPNYNLEEAKKDYYEKRKEREDFIRTRENYNQKLKEHQEFIRSRKDYEDARGYAGGGLVNRLPTDIDTDTDTETSAPAPLAFTPGFSAESESQGPPPDYNLEEDKKDFYAKQKERQDLVRVRENYAKGGLVNRRLKEGKSPPNAGVADDLPRNLSEGEYVIPKHIVDHFGEKFFEELLETIPPPRKMRDQLRA